MPWLWFRTNSVEDVFAEGEPNAAQLAKLIEYAKENHITTIFAEIWLVQKYQNLAQVGAR